MKASDVTICVLMPKYELGEGIPVTQYMDIPFNVYGIRKNLEHLGVNMIDFMIVKYNGAPKLTYGIAVDMESSEFDTADEVLNDIYTKMNIEHDQYKLAEIFTNVLNKNLIN
ncbi:hypothetical protein JC221_062 [Yersinia phage JC221]|nr:hypothetical protein JC221_062 [Yersinia phage JC221]